MKECLLIRNWHRIRRVEVEDILYIMRNNRKLMVATNHDKWTYYEKIHNVVPLLNKDFYGALTGLYINLSKVVAMEDNTIVFENGESVSLGNKNFNKTKKYYIEYLNNGILHNS